MTYTKQKSLGFVIEQFTKDLIASFDQLKLNYKKINIDITKFIPSPFNDLSTLVVSSFYYSKKDRIEINFVKGKKGSFHYNVIEEEIWRANMFDNESGVINELYSLANVLPTLNPPYLEIYGYGMFYSFEEFVKTRKNTIDIAYFMLSSTLAFDRISEPGDRPETRIKKFESLALEFQMKLEDPATSEKELDDFLNDNPVILERTLEIDKFISEPILKNVIGKYPHDLKPDGMGYNAKQDQWAVIDYKLANKELLKNVGKVRTGLRADVGALQDQLRDYVEYFQENDHRKYFEQKYDVIVKHPYAIGIIGMLKQEHQSDLNRIIHDFPKWFNLYPYNNILKSFTRYIDHIRKIILP